VSSYKDKFKESQDLAHSQVIATKILREMDELRSKLGNSPNAPRRWIWELIQNAKDVHPEGGVKVCVEVVPDAKEPHITFKHNGKPFTANDIRFLIEQISTKDRAKDDEGKRKTTGKFGTGFLTTHLLSETVRVTGVAKEPDLNYVKFELTLDRSSNDLDGITAAVQKAKQSIENLDTRPAYSGYKEGRLNTAFRYLLEDQSSLDVAKAGLKDLSNCLPYSLIFVPELENVEIVSVKSFSRKSNFEVALSDGITLATVVIDERGKSSSFTVAKLTKGLTSIIVPINVEGASITLLPIGEDVPRLFCDFPLIGTERFPFPVIVNNPNFNPTDPRDGIFLTSPPRVHQPSEENKVFMREAVELYFQLLRYATNNKWENLHLLAQIPPGSSISEVLDQKWLKRDVSDPIRKQLLQAKIVNTASGDLASMLSNDGSICLWFPYGGTRELRERIWAAAQQWFPHRLPRQFDIELWYKLSWTEYGKLTIAQLASFVESKKTLADLAAVLKLGRNVFDWLNEFYALLRSDEKEYDSIINRRLIFPDQNGALRKKGELNRDAGDIIEEFKDILLHLGRDIRAELVADGVHDEFEATKKLDRNFIVKLITAEINEKANDREVAKSYTTAFKKLLLYFRRESEQAKALFPVLYQNKHHLYNDEEILDNVNKAEQLADLLTEFRVIDVVELRNLIARGVDPKKSLLPVTQEILVSMGITSLDEWLDALKDKNLAALFSHQSTPTPDMFVYAQSLISQAKQRVIAHLQTLPQYDLSQMDETAPTVLAGVLKNNQSIYIAIRPAYGGQVIIYYGSELDVLDYETSELWIDEGDKIRRITLGHILRTAEIKKFPV